MLTHVQRQINVLDAQEEIKSKVQAEIGDRQREMFLREQMKAIQDELGEGEGGADELDELREKLDALELPEDARKEVDREFGRLSRMGRESMESQVIRTYLETIAELPWNTRTDEQLDLKRRRPGARGGPLRPRGRQGPRARVPRGAPAPAPAQAPRPRRRPAARQERQRQRDGEATSRTPAVGRRSPRRQ